VFDVQQVKVEKVSEERLFAMSTTSAPLGNSL